MVARSQIPGEGYRLKEKRKSGIISALDINLTNLQKQGGSKLNCRFVKKMGHISTAVDNRYH